jgi:DNA-binding NarL/FixJ family response regulator
MTIDPRILELATSNLTPGQLEVFRLWHTGMSQRAIAHHLGLARSTIVDRYDAACLRLHRQGVRFTPAGQPYLKEHTTA